MMRFAKKISVQVSSRRSMLKPTDCFARILLHDEMLAEIRPMKWGWWEPLDHIWDLSDLNVFIPPDRGGKADLIAWSRTGRIRASGMFGVNALPSADSERFHATEQIHCSLESAPLKSLIDYVKRSCIDFDGDIGFVHYISNEEAPLRHIESEFDGVYLSSSKDGSQMALKMDERTLRYWLPTLPWAAVFGEAYVRLFGMDLLMSAPAFKVEKLSDSAVYIQLTPSLFDLETDYQSFHATRLKVQAHLGNEAFFDPSRAYPLRGPRGTIPADQFLKALADFRCPPPGTNGFKVPEFHFIED